MSVRGQLFCAMNHLRSAKDESEEVEERMALLDVMYLLSRAMKRTSQLDIPVTEDNNGKTTD